MKKVELRESQAPYTLDVDEDTLADEPVILERNGEPVAVILPIAEYEALYRQFRAETQEDSDLAKLAQDRAAFLAMKKELLESHLGQYVAFKDGEFVDADPDESTLVKRLHDRFGVVTFYVKKVEPQARIYRIPGPRLAR